MPRLLGVDIPREKRIDAALRYIHGIGWTRSRAVLDEAKIEPARRAKDLSDEEIARLAGIIQNNYITEGELRRTVNQNIRRHMDIGTGRGLRHRRGLPVRGQRTRTNARTRKGHKSIFGKIRKK